MKGRVNFRVQLELLDKRQPLLVPVKVPSFHEELTTDGQRQNRSERAARQARVGPQLRQTIRSAKRRRC